MPKKRSDLLETFSYQVTRLSGSSYAFLLALGAIVIWAITGPLFGFSNTWQLVINTGTTIVTFLMVFLIQRAQNKDAVAIHLKLNEIVAAMEGASNRLIDIEDLSESEIGALHNYYRQLIQLARKTKTSPLPTRSRKLDQATAENIRKNLRSSWFRLKVTVLSCRQ